MADLIRSQALGGAGVSLYRMITFSSSAAVQLPVSALVQLNKPHSSYSNSPNAFHQQELLYISCTKHEDSDV